MKTNKTSGALSVPLVIFIVLAFIVGLFYVQSISQPVTSDAITSIEELNDAEAELDTQDVDGIGNEMPETDKDASSF